MRDVNHKSTGVREGLKLPGSVRVLASLSRGVNSPLPVFGAYVQSAAVSGICPEQRGNIYKSTEKERETCPTESPPPPALSRPGTWHWLEFYWRRTVLWTTAWRDFSRARVVRNNCKTGRKRGWRQSSVATELLTKKRQNGHQNVVFWCHVWSSKRFGRWFCRNRSNKK